MADCPYVRGTTTKHCSLAEADVERVQREHRDELARLREIERAARRLLEVHDSDHIDAEPYRRADGSFNGLALGEAAVGFAERLDGARSQLRALLDQKERSEP